MKIEKKLKTAHHNILCPPERTTKTLTSLTQNSALTNSLDIYANIVHKSKRTYQVSIESLMRVKARQERIKECGRHGFLMLSENLDIWFFPKTCKSLLCKPCSKRRALRQKGIIEELIKALLKKSDRAAFLTLTLLNMPDVVEAVGFAYDCLSAFRDYVLSYKKLKRMFPRFIVALAHYGRRLKANGVEKWVVRKIIKKHLERYGEFMKKLKVTGRVRIREYLAGVFAFQITHSSTGWHPHWHGVVTHYIPQILLSLIWRDISGSYVVDIRGIRNKKKALKYISKYMTAPLFKIEEGKVEMEELQLLEAALMDRNRFRYWGISHQKTSSFLSSTKRKGIGKKNGHYFSLPVRVELKGEITSWDVRKILREWLRDGENRDEEKKLCDCVLTYWKGQLFEVEGEAWLRRESRIKIVCNNSEFQTFLEEKIRRLRRHEVIFKNIDGEKSEGLVEERIEEPIMAKGRDPDFDDPFAWMEERLREIEAELNMFEKIHIPF
ncbi:MAG: hypothetical protein ABWJ99_04615 [Caldimicrobium sp.]